MNTEQNPTKRILILGGRAPATLDLIRILGRQGHQIFLAESLSPALSEKSIYVEKNFLIAPPAQCRAQFREDLLRIIEENRIEWLLPTCEEVFHVARDFQMVKLPHACRVFCAPLSTLNTLHDKWAFNQFAAEFHPATPQSFLVESIEEIQRLPFEKFVLKPQYSRFAEEVLFLQKDFDAGTLRQTISIGPERRWVAQEHINGQEVCTFGIAIEGQLQSHVSYEHPFTVGKGSGISFRSIRNLLAESFVQKVVEKTGYTGLIAFDFIFDGEQVFPLECNPRLTSGIHLLQEQAENFFRPTTDQISFSESGQFRYLGLAHLVYGPKQITSLQKLSQWLEYFFKAKDVIFDRSDWRPWFWQFACFLHLLRRGKALNKTALATSTFDIEWNGL